MREIKKIGVAGAGTNIAIPQAMKEVDKFKSAAEKKLPEE